jgi:hypothetical protein
MLEPFPARRIPPHGGDPYRARHAAWLRLREEFEYGLDLILDGVERGFEPRASDAKGAGLGGLVRVAVADPITRVKARSDDLANVEGRVF